MTRWAWSAVGALVVAGIAAVLAGLAIGGTADEVLILDPGPVVRWGLPIVTTISHIAAGVTVGSLVVACLATPLDSPAYERVASFASLGASVWTVTLAAAGLFSFAATIGSEIRFDDSFGAALWQYLSDTEAGVNRAWAVIFAAVAALVIAFTRNHWWLLVAGVISVAGLVPVAALGHAGGTADHNIAWNAMWLHLIGTAVWVGGLAAIVVARANRAITERYSTIALLCFVVVTGSGVARAFLSFNSLDELWTPYGTILLIKMAALVVLGIAGAVNRRWAISRMGGDRRFFAWVVIAEVILMGIATGMATALGQTAPPRVSEPTGTSPAEILTGSPLPPPPDAAAYLFGWRPDLLWLTISLGLGFFYLAGVIRMHRRGDRWPVLRTISWFAGLLVLVWVTSGGVNVYQDKLFSAHMLGHMILGMVVPVLLVPGAPVTLALRTIRKRDDGSWGPREWIMAIVHSTWFRIVGNPYVAAFLFVVSLWAFYYTPVFSWATTTHLGHEWMVLHFLLTGYLFVQALIGIDPAPNRPSYPVRLLLLLATMALHAFFGLAIMTGTGLLLADWYGAMGWDIGITALQDQQRAGGIAWSVGELPTIALAIAVAVQWSRSDTRLQRRLDRQADRDGDAELEAYNQMLAARAKADARAED